MFYNKKKNIFITSYYINCFLEAVNNTNFLINGDIMTDFLFFIAFHNLFNLIYTIPIFYNVATHTNEDIVLKQFFNKVNF